MEVITSRDNRLIKYTRRLLSHKGRETERRFILEGYRLVSEALKKPELVDYLLVSTGYLERCQDKPFVPGIPRYQVSDPVMQAVTGTQTPPGLLAVCRKPVWNQEEVLAGDSILLIIDNIRDPGNLGTIIRTAWAAGVDAVFLTKGTVDAYSPKVVRSTMGAVLNLPLFDRVEPGEVGELRARGYRFLLAEPEGREFFYDADYRGKVALVIGGEATGISEGFRDIGTGGIRIPLRPGVDSLNAAVACGIILYAAWQQRRL